MRYPRILIFMIALVTIAVLLYFLINNRAFLAGHTENTTDSAWAFGSENALPFKNMGFENWGWSNGPYCEGTYSLCIYAGAKENVLEKGIIVGEAVITYIDGHVEVVCKMFDDFFTLKKAHLWIGETELPLTGRGKKAKPTNTLRQLRYDLNEEYQFDGDIYVALHAEVKISPLATEYGADVNPTGNPIGGGDGYTDIISRDNHSVKYIVNSRDTLVSSLKSAQMGDVIYVEEDANIDMTGACSTNISDGVTLASNRGEDGSPGGRIYQTTGGTQLFRVYGENVRITGLRIEGPHKDVDVPDPTNVMLFTQSLNLEVDNCEIFGWSDAAIGIAGTSGSDTKTGGYIHHNYIHHNQAAGLGYGVVLSNGGVALIEANYFDYCRHAISGTGEARVGYEARYNICGLNWISTSPHQFDMHGITTGSGAIAGGTIKVYHNTFMGMTSEMPTCIAIRGIPCDGAYISNNWFYFTNSAPVWQRFTYGNVYMTNNLIGLDKQLSVKGPILIYE